MGNTAIITLTGASGSGKTSIFKALQSINPRLQLIESYTTRKPRGTDLPGEYVYMESQEKFSKLKAEGKFLWDVGEHNNAYGTLKESVDQALRADTPKIMLLVPKSVPLLMARTDKVIPFYILSPGEEILRKRLQKRGDKPEEIEKRISDCRDWDAEARESAAN